MTLSLAYHCRVVLLNSLLPNTADKSGDRHCRGNKYLYSRKQVRMYYESGTVVDRNDHFINCRCSSKRWSSAGRQPWPPSWKFDLKTSEL